MSTIVSIHLVDDQRADNHGVALLGVVPLCADLVATSVFDQLVVVEPVDDGEGRGADG